MVIRNPVNIESVTSRPLDELFTSAIEKMARKVDVCVDEKLKDSAKDTDLRQFVTEGPCNIATEPSAFKYFDSKELAIQLVNRPADAPFQALFAQLPAEKIIEVTHIIIHASLLLSPKYWEKLFKFDPVKYEAVVKDLLKTNNPDDQNKNLMYADLALANSDYAWLKVFFKKNEGEFPDFIKPRQKIQLSEKNDFDRDNDGYLSLSELNSFIKAGESLSPLDAENHYKKLVTIILTHLEKNRALLLLQGMKIECELNAQFMQIFQPRLIEWINKI